MVFLFERLHYQDGADERRARMSIEGPHTISDTASYALACVPNGAQPEMNLVDLRDTNALEKYVRECAEGDLEPDEMRRYIAETFMAFREVGGYERDRSFVDMTTFDDLDFGRGLAACAGWLGLTSAAPVILDTESFELVDV